MSLDAENLRFAVDDARKRHQGALDLIHASDRQAMAMLQVYIALAVASLSGSAVILLSASIGLPKPIGFGLAGFGATTVIAALFALAVMWPTEVLLPGRRVDFWQWADRPDVSIEHALRTYLAEAAEKERHNSMVNDQMAKAMLCAKILGAASPVVGYVVGSVALITRV